MLTFLDFYYFPLYAYTNLKYMSLTLTTYRLSFLFISACHTDSNLPDGKYEYECKNLEGTAAMCDIFKYFLLYLDSK